MLKLLTSLMLLVVVSNASNLLKQDNSHWCCKINVAPLILEQTRVVTVSAQKLGKYRCGYQGCGFLGLGTCTKWCETTWIETSSYIEHYTVSQPQSCPQDQITCCSGHYLIHGHCLSLEDINNDPALLAELIQQGILLPEGK